MDQQALIDELSSLLSSESRGLFRHLNEAQPYLSSQTYHIWERLRPIAAVSQIHAQRLSSLFERLALSPRAASYDTNVASFHFMDLQRLVPLLVQEKSRQVAAYERAIAHADEPGPVRRELEQLLDENRGHLTTLNECQAGLTARPAAA